jgi:thiamine biosynthesis lipoprotein
VSSHHSFEVWGLSGSITTTDTDALDYAVEVTQDVLRRMTAAASRFDASSELCALNASTEPFQLSPLLSDVFVASQRAWQITGGACDPTVLPSLEALGYGSDYDQLDEHTGARRDTQPAPGLESVDFDPLSRIMTRPAGLRFDFGATAKALTCDLIANTVAPTSGVCVEIGGDVSVRGTGPEGPWVIGVTASWPPTGSEPRIGMTTGGVATSSSKWRTWRHDGASQHHLIDPRTGLASTGPFQTASVAADTCVTANAFATACVVWGEAALHRTIQAGWSARVVTTEQAVIRAGGWPEDMP